AKTKRTQIDIDVVVENAYREYAQYVATERAIPDVRDGLKPVQRRILYAMHDLGLRSNTPPKKSARIVGEVLGKYLPHGDGAVYDAMVRMAQAFTMRGPLVDGHGNFGSADGDGAAAMRYTEARLSKLGEAVLEDIDKDAVEWQDNFDTTLREPTVLPARIPNLLLNGAAGIAVGIATSIPPHNLGELCDAVVYLCQNWGRRDKVNVPQLMKYVKGPDFPTGGILVRNRVDAEGKPYDAIALGYKEGFSEGGFVCFADVDIESIGGGKTEIVVKSLPYGSAKLTVMERIAKARDKFPGVTDVRDESDREHGMRLVIETARGHDPMTVLERLFKQTVMQTSISYNAVGIVHSGDDAYPVEGMSLRFMLEQFVAHRLDVVLRRAKYELERAERRLHIVEGLLEAVDALDEVIHLIRKSENAEAASNGLQKFLKIDATQAQAILDMQLRALARLNVQRLKDEAADLKKRIAALKQIVGSEAKRLEVVIEETKATHKEFATPRRTKIVDSIEEGLPER
ncbi:MAG TPA: DNA gyrase subunit A, partial [Anaerolineales bacterium]|nr:DNA gyrase subunit A [Anaerolineales bacterium]